MAVEPASFRDPSGFVFERAGVLYRQVQHAYQAEYDELIASSLYRALTTAGLLISHVEAPLDQAHTAEAYRVLQPERVPFVSYPYEWCFSQLRDAALLTLKAQKTALSLGMSLKDASAYNVQFRAGKPILIDTLSFERYEEGRPWIAYRQFCQHFLAPLALMSRTDVRLGGLLRQHIDGIPLDLAGKLLPGSTKLQPGLLMHIHMHGRSQKRHEGSGAPAAAVRMGRTALLGLIDSLESAVRSLAWKPEGTEWGEYYAHTNYSEAAMQGKQRLVEEMLAAVSPAPATVWDLGANTGAFSRIAAQFSPMVVAWDVDPAAAERNYVECKARGEERVLPLLQDLTSPSPDLGWALRERKSLLRRGPADIVLALALVHHLAIGNNVPLGLVAEFFRFAGRRLIVEFVPKTDSQVQRLLSSREDIFTGYTEDGFEAAFTASFRTLRRERVPESERTLYLMEAREAVAEVDDTARDAEAALCR